MRKFVASWLYFFFILAGCAHKKKVVPLPERPWKHEYREVDERVMYLVRRIEAYAGYKMPFLRVKIVPMAKKYPNAGGLCNMVTRTIYLPEEKWFDKFSETTKETILLHEIGHCVLGRHHTSPRHTDLKSCSPSLMNWNGTTDECYIDHQHYYIRELFDGQ